jgi:cell division protein FtsW (lipid II flippase)
MLVLGAERDIGFAVLVFVLFLSMLWTASGRWTYLLVGVVMFVGGAIIAGHLFSQVHLRIEEWLHPDPTGQVMQGFYGFGSGGLIGTGLGFGQVSFIPYVWSDLIFAAFGTEMGLLGTSIIVFAFMLLMATGLQIAQTARSDFAKMAATGFAVILGVQAFVIMGGILRVLPLTGITLPFIAYGGSSLVANYVLVALLMRISDEGSRPTVTAKATATLVPPDYSRAGPAAGGTVPRAARA